MLNVLWVAFFLVAFVSAIYQSVFCGNTQIWTALSESIFESSKNAFSISINLTGILCFWLGMLKIAEESGITRCLAKILYPFFHKIMPALPKESPALSSIIMNMAANILGLDNAATPMGLKAMEQLQKYNPKKDTASNEQILFMVINSSAVTLIPITILMYRTELGATNPAAVFIPILLATSCSTLVGFLSVAFVQKLKIFTPIVLSVFGGLALFIGATAYAFLQLSPENRVLFSSEIGNFILFSFIVSFLFAGIKKRINLYETFISGAKEGFEIAVKIIPYLVAMLVAIAVLRASGSLNLLILGIEKIVAALGINTDFVPALPTAFMKPLSGSGARAMMIETMNNYGADSFASFVSCTIQGSTETTFYVLAVYFGAVKISKTRHALPCALLADLAGIVAAIYFSYMFF